jgi:restriction system protein
MAAKRRRRRKKSSSDAIAPAVVIIVLVLLFQQISENPAPYVIAGVLLLTGAAVFLALRLKRRRALELLQAERDQHIALTDGMSGRDFEQWTARLLRRTGCTEVQVVGGAGDAGLDVLALSPSGLRIVVQCKRYNHLTAKVGSPDVQRFAGTARIVHDADIALMITTTTYTAPAEGIARKAGIVLVNRALLAEWARTGAAPPVTGLLTTDAR